MNVHELSHMVVTRREDDDLIDTFGMVRDEWQERRKQVRVSDLSGEDQ